MLSVDTEIRRGAVWITLLDATTLPPLRGNAAWFERAGLTDAEIHAAEAFRHPLAQACHLGARLLARSALADRTGCPPRAFEFAPGPFGKPTVRSPDDALGWEFNLSHGGCLVACATARHPVGIDVEPRTRAIDPLPIARAHFRPEEAAWLDATEAHARDRFLALWTIKEAYLKARGVGLSVPLSTVRVVPVGGLAFAAHAADDAGAAWRVRLHRVQGHWLALATLSPDATSAMTWWRQPQRWRRPAAA